MLAFDLVLEVIQQPDFPEDVIYLKWDLWCCVSKKIGRTEMRDVSDMLIMSEKKK